MTTKTVMAALALLVPAVLVAGFGLVGYFGLNAWFGSQTDRQLAAFQDVVQMPERTAHVTITLP